MPKTNTSLKHLAVSKANTTVVFIVAIASFVIVLSGFSVNALLSQRSYQSRVIGEKEIARDQMEENVDNADRLLTSYQSFISTPDNLIGGASEGSGVRDGDNATIVLDSLPSSYDFPALITSIEKLVEELDLTIATISGQDQEISNQDVSTDFPVEIPVGVSIIGTYDDVKDFVEVLERSIRPFKINRLSLIGADDSIKLEIDQVTYFQPEKTFEVTEEVVE